MFCMKKHSERLDNKKLPIGNLMGAPNESTADSNACFLRAAKDGNLQSVLDCLKGNIDINTANANGLNALHLAAKEGHVEIVTELLKRGANVNAATKKGNTALHIASLAGQEEVVRVLTSLGANVNVQSQNGFTPLYMAAQENHDSVVSFLLANGANQSLATEDGFTPLAVALQQGHDKVVAVLLENDTKGRIRLPALHIAAKKDDCKAASLLLQSDYNPDVTSKSGFTPLHIAAHYGNERIANILLDKGADVNYAAKHQITPLHVASKWGKANMVTLLIENSAKVEAVTRDGLTPLHCAARSGHDQVVDLLLEKGAPILAKTKNGLAPLHMASQGDHVDSARILLYHKAPVDDVTVDYLTALHVAAHCGHVKVAKLLLDRKADPNARALNGFTPLHIACKKNRMKVVELLLKNGASIEATTESGLSPLHVAAFMGCMNIVIHLIQNGANPDVPTVRGETPLHLAARANQIDIIRILLRNGANVDARAREDQTPLHIAARLGNVDIVSLLLQHGAAIDAKTKDMYTALHIAAKEGQEEVASVLIDHDASLTANTKRGFTPLHLAAKYGNIKVIKLLLQKDAPVDAQGKNGLTPLHVAAHYNHINEALSVLEKGASPHATAKNGYTALHITAKKNQMDISTALLEYGAKCNAESKTGYTPLHLSSQEGHAEMTALLIENQADVNSKANNGLTPLHLCAQEDRVDVASVLIKNGAKVQMQTNAGYTPLHVASHFGHINMVRFLLQNRADVHAKTEHGYTPLHQASQQGHVPVVNLLLANGASPNETTLQGHTPLSIAQRLGYISVVETLKIVTETTVTTTTTITEEKYKVVSPEIMQETFLTDSEDEGGEDAMLGDQSYRYLTADEMKSLGDDSLPMDVTKDEKHHEALHVSKNSSAPMVEEDKLSPQHIISNEIGFSENFSPDNIDISHVPVHAGFLVSFMVDARGGAMRGCRHSGVRVIIPPRKASMPMRITCRYLRKEKLVHPPPLMEGEACASRILEVGPVGARFLGPVIIEVPHFASLRGREREVTILRSDTGESWREHSLEASEEAVQDVLNESFEGDEFSALEDLNTNRITRILTTDFPQYFAVITRIRQEVHTVGPEGGKVTSTVVPQVQAVFPEGALQKKIKVCLQAQPISPELVTRLLGNRVAVSPIVTVEPRRRKFHKEITLTIPVPQAASKGMINQYSSDAPTLRLLCSITGSTKSAGSSKAQWEDVTASTSLMIVNECVSFTTTVSARFWLMDCRQVNEVTKFATELYQEAIHVPFMAKFVIFSKRHDPNEAQMRVFCMSDDKEDKTLEIQEHFTEIAKSRDVEVLEDKLQYLEFAGNLVPVMNSGEQLKFAFQAFHENRLPFIIRVKDPHGEAVGRIAFMREPKVSRGEAPQTPICNLNIALPEVFLVEPQKHVYDIVTIEVGTTVTTVQDYGSNLLQSSYHVDLHLSDIARELDKDWVVLAYELGVSQTDISFAKAKHPHTTSEQALAMLRIWSRKFGCRAAGEELEKGLLKINRNDVIEKCIEADQTTKESFKEADKTISDSLAGFNETKMQQKEELVQEMEKVEEENEHVQLSYEDKDIMKEAESFVETSSETGSVFEKEEVLQMSVDQKDTINHRRSKTPPPSPASVTEESKGISYVENLSQGSEVVITDSKLEENTFKEISTVVIESDACKELRKSTTQKKELETGFVCKVNSHQISVSSALNHDDESKMAAISDAHEKSELDGILEIKKWMEVDESGTIKHHIQKTTHMMLSMDQTAEHGRQLHNARSSKELLAPVENFDKAKTASEETKLFDDEQNVLVCDIELGNDGLCTQDALKKSKVSESPDSTMQLAKHLHPVSHEFSEVKTQKICKDESQKICEDETCDRDEEHIIKLCGESEMISDGEIPKKDNYSKNYYSENINESEIPDELSKTYEPSLLPGSTPVSEVEDATSERITVGQNQDLQNNEKVLTLECDLIMRAVPVRSPAEYKLEILSAEENIGSAELIVVSNKNDSSPQDTVENQDFSEAIVCSASAMAEEELIKNSAGQEEKNDIPCMQKTNISKDTEVIISGNDAMASATELPLETQNSPENETLIIKRLESCEESSNFSRVMPNETISSEKCFDKSKEEECITLKAKFSPLAFDNSAFVGADFIDACEKPTDLRSRSPYEVLRDESDPALTFFSPEVGDRYVDHSAAESRLSVKHKKILHQISSEISEELADIESSSLDPKSKGVILESQQKLTAPFKSESKASSKNDGCELKNIKINTNERANIESDLLSEDEPCNLQAIDYTSVTEHFSLSSTDNVEEPLSSRFHTDIKNSSFEQLNKNELGKMHSLAPKKRSDYLSFPSTHEFDLISDSRVITVEVTSKQFNVENEGEKSSQNSISSKSKHGYLQTMSFDKKEAFSCTTKLFHDMNDADTNYSEDRNIFSNSQLVMENKIYGDEEIDRSLSEDMNDSEFDNILILTTEEEDPDLIERPKSPEPPVIAEVRTDDYMGEFLNLVGTGAYSKTTVSTLEGVDSTSHHKKKAKVDNTNSFVPVIQPDIQLDEEFEIIDESEIEGLMHAVSHELTFEPENRLRKMGSYKDITTVHLSHGFEGDSQDFDSHFSSHMSKSEDAEDTSGFIYGMQFERDLEDQSEEAMDIDSDQYSEEKDLNYAYGMRFEREHELEGEADEIPCYGDLYTHQEEDEDAIEEIEKVKISSVGKVVDFDTLAGRKCFAKSGDLDDVSVSSLQEFERLEEEIHSGRRSSIGSADSLNGKQYISKSGEHDDVSMTSLTEFEKLERECLEAERPDVPARDVTTRLSEIEEGQESLTSETSQGTLSDLGKGEKYETFQSKLEELSSSTNDFIQEDAVKKLSESKIFPKLQESKNSHGSYQLYTSLEEHAYSPDDNLHTDAYLESVSVIAACSKNESETGSEFESADRILGGDIRKRCDESCGASFQTYEQADDLEKDSLRDEKSIKPDSLSDDENCDYQDSLHEEKLGDIDSLQEDIQDSLLEKKPADEDSLHEMDILPDESSLSLESSFAAVVYVSHDSLSEKIDPCAIVSDLDFDNDSLRDLNASITIDSGITFHSCEITEIRAKRNGDRMVSSTDSLEHSSSATIHPAQEYENESLSCSANSTQVSEDCAMISSTDASDTEILSSSFGIPFSGMQDVPKESKLNHAVDAEGNFPSESSKNVVKVRNEAYELPNASEMKEIWGYPCLEAHMHVRQPASTVKFHSQKTECLDIAKQPTELHSRKSRGKREHSILSENPEMNAATVEDEIVVTEEYDMNETQSTTEGHSEKCTSTINSSVKILSDVSDKRS